MLVFYFFMVTIFVIEIKPSDQSELADAESDAAPHLSQITFRKWPLRQERKPTPLPPRFRLPGGAKESEQSRLPLVKSGDSQSSAGSEDAFFTDTSGFKPDGFELDLMRREEYARSIIVKLEQQTVKKEEFWIINECLKHCYNLSRLIAEDKTKHSIMSSRRGSKIWVHIPTGLADECVRLLVAIEKHQEVWDAVATCCKINNDSKDRVMQGVFRLKSLEQH